MIQLVGHMRYHKRQSKHRKRHWPWLAAFLGLGGLVVYLIAVKLPERQSPAELLIPLKEEVAVIEAPEQVDIEPDLNLNDPVPIVVPENTLPSPDKERPEKNVNIDKEKTATGTEAAKISVLLDVPFHSQAPLGGWDDPAQQDGCEEASILMAMRWIKGEPPLNADQLIQELRAAEEYQKEVIDGFHGDTSVQDTLDILIKEYFGWDEVQVKEIEEAEDIYNELEAGNPVIVPVNGRILANPHYTAPGPDHHMLLVIGYDYATQEFITNDPGTRYGASYRYSQERLLSAIADYPTTMERPFNGSRRMIIMGKE